MRRSHAVWFTLALFWAMGIAEPSCGLAAPPTTFAWLRQFGPTGDTGARGVAANPLGHVFVSSVTPTNGFGTRKDVSLAKYDSQGNLAWNIPTVTNTGDANYGIWADSLGNSYIASTTELGLDGPNVGGPDAFVRKYDGDGAAVWTRQLGTSALDFGTATVANGPGDVFVTGYTLGDYVGTKQGGWDAFLAKYDSSGAPQWTRQFGTALDDYGTGLAADAAGNVYVVGITHGSLGGVNPNFSSDAYVRKFDSTGSIVWTRQLGTAGTDFAENLAVDGAGNVYVTGTTSGQLGASHFGGEDAFVTKLDAAGNVEWLRQFGTTQSDNSIGIALDNVGRIYLAGVTLGALASPAQGSYDAFVAVYSSTGAPLATRQFGTADADNGWGVAWDGAGSIYVTGGSGAMLPSLPPTRMGGGYLAKITVPEPGSTWLMLFAMTIGITHVRRRDGWLGASPRAPS